MKITISKNTITSLNSEVTALSNLISGEANEVKPVNFKKAVKRSKKDDLKYFSLTDDGETMTVEVDDEVFFIVIDSYRAMAKGLNMIYQGCKYLASQDVKDQVKHIQAKLERKN